MLIVNYVAVAFVAVYLAELGFFLWMERLNRKHLEAAGDNLPRCFEGVIDRETLVRSNAYTLARSRLATAHKTVSDLILLALILSGAVVGLDRVSGHLGLGDPWSGLAFFLLLAAIFWVLDLPWDYYSTFVLEERFGFNKSDLKTWLTDKAKGAAISAVLLAVLILPVLWMVKAFPQYWWLCAFAVVSLVQLALVVLYPILIAPLFNKFAPLQDAALAEKVEALIRSVGLRAQGVFQMDAGRRSGHSNAYFTGIGRTKRVVLFDTLLKTHTHEEILGVLAHELGHFKLKHVVKSFLLSQAVLFVGLYLTYLVMNWNLFPETFGFDPARFPVSLFFIGVFGQRVGFVFKPLFAGLSRRFETEADVFAMRLQNNPGPLVAALKRLVAENLANLNPHPLYVWFNYSHPPVHERIHHLEVEAEGLSGLGKRQSGAYA
ncbi:MAG: M48 family metallopeptidase [Desulfomonile tiedjei]|nr:M48 family metallopeptidase [Desulfomonile tiedjei]